MVLPEKIFGYDTDDILGYQTQKMTYIRDRWVGLGYYVLMSFVVFWVVFGTILWRNEHFQLRDVNGVARLWFSHPTVEMCDPDEWSCQDDFTSMERLPYCQQSSGPKSENAARCIYMDKFSSLTNPNQNDNVFIPTSSVTFTEHLRCDPQDPNCEHVYEREQTGYYYDPSVITYAADVERFRLQMTSSYERGGVAGTSLEHQGHVEECVEDPLFSQRRSWPERVKKRRDGCSKRGGTKHTALECGSGMTCVMVHEEPPDLVADLPGGSESSFYAHSTDHDSKIESTEGGAPLQPMATRSPSKKAGRMLNRRRDDEKPVHRNKDVSLLASSERLRNRAASAAGGKASEATVEAARNSFSLQASRQIQGHRQTEDMYATPWGDQFLLGKLLSVAGVSLDHDYNGDGYTVRQTGTILEIEAQYNNLYHISSTFGYQAVQYTYHIHELAVPYMNREFFAPVQPENYPESRTIINEHGILIVFKVSGQFGFFNIVSLLLMLSIVGAMLGSAQRVTDLAAIYLHPKKRNYFHLKYELSSDFSDMWQCHTCGFWNDKDETVCKGLDKWESSKDTPLCGTPKEGAWQCDTCELYNDKRFTECQHYDHRPHKCKAPAPVDRRPHLRSQGTLHTPGDRR